MTKEINERKIVLDILNKVDTNKSYVNILLNNYLKNTEINNQKWRLITELVYGVIRRRNTIDWYLSNLCKLKVQDNNIINILRIGAYQILFLDRIPDYAIVSESVNLAKKYGNKSQGGFVNAVLRNLKRKYKEMQFPKKENDLVKYFSLIYSFNEWLIKLFLDKFGEEKTQEICTASNLPAPITIRVNTIKISNDLFKNNLINNGIIFKESKFINGNFLIELKSENSLLEKEEYQKGWFQIQDESSTLAGLAVCPQPDELVIDLCSAPGGKITHLAALMKNKGRLIGGDIHPARLNLVAENSKRLGIEIIELYEVSQIIKNFSQKADRVLVDVPCSGLGVLRRRLDARWNKKHEDIKKIPSLQYKILEDGYKCLRQGGILVYSTCTILPEENEEIIFKFLRNHPDMKIENLANILTESVKNFIDLKGFLKILPSPSHTMDGFFIARLRKE